MINFTKPWANTSALDFDADTTLIEESDALSLDFSVKWSSLGGLNFTEPDQVQGDDIHPSMALGIRAFSTRPQSKGALAQVYTFSITQQKKEPTCTGKIDQIIGFNIADVESPIATTSGDCVNDINVERNSVRNITKAQFNTSSKVRSEFISNFKDSPRKDNQLTIVQCEAESLNKVINATYTGMNYLDYSLNITLTNGIKLSTDVMTDYEFFDDVNNSSIFTIVDGNIVTNGLSSLYRLPASADCDASSKWMEAERLNTYYETDFQDGLIALFENKTKFGNGVQPIGYRPKIIKPVEPIIPEVSPELNFLQLWDQSAELDFLRIELDALIIMNEISIYHIADDGTKTAIHPVSASLELDIDSQVWSFKGQLFGADSLTWLTYRANFEINVNGHQLLFVLREYSRVSSFASDAYAFTAVTNTQWLFSPYANLYSGAVENETGVWQIVEEILTQENFTLSRTLTPEWILAPDSFSYLNKTPIEMAIQAAQASGAILQPNKTGNSLDVQPRYKVSPWNWNTLTDEQCDHVINADYVITESSSDNTTTEINRVLISGETHGVITDVVKSGTAGDVRGSDVVSNLSQDHNVNMELARNIMGDSGDQEILGLSLPLLAPDSDFGLLLPGEIVRIVYTDKTITGLCLSNSVPIQSITDVSQSVKLELNNGYR